VATGAPLHLQLQVLPFRVARESFKGKVQSVFIDGGEFTDAHADGKHLRAGMTLGFCGNTFENRRGDSNFVHSVPSTDTRQLIADEHVYDARGTQQRAQDYHARVIGSDAPDDCGVLAQGMMLQRA